MELNAPTDKLLVTHSASITRIFLNDGTRNNVINAQWVDALDDAISQAVHEKSSRVIVIAAEGPHFCQGLDLDALLSGDDADRVRLFEGFQRLLTNIQECPLPVIASVEGNVSGGGLGLIAACDLVIAKNSASFMLPEAIAGMIPAIITPFLLRRLTPARLQALAVSTRSLEAREAHAWGLVDEVTSEDLKRVTDRQCQRLLRSYPDALTCIKQSIHQAQELNFEQQNAAALSHIGNWLEKPEVLDGIQSFADGFSPEWFQKLKKES